MQVMGLFGKKEQHIVIAGKDQQAIETFAGRLRAIKLRDTKVSPVTNTEGQSQCNIDCKSAEPLYNQELLPLLYDTTGMESCQVLLTFDDNSALVSHCPMELLVSLGFDSRYAYGNKAEHEFIQKLHGDILLQHSADKPAAVAYYIVGGGVITICIPCADPEAMEQNIGSKLDAFRIKKYTVTVHNRESA